MLPYTAIVDGVSYHPELEKFYWLFNYLDDFECEDYAICRFNNDAFHFFFKKRELRSCFVLVLGSQVLLNEVLESMAYKGFKSRIIYVPLKDKKGQDVSHLETKIKEKIYGPCEEVRLYKYNDKEYIDSLKGGYFPFYNNESFLKNMSCQKNKEDVTMRIYTDSKTIIGKYSGFLWQNDYLDDLYMGQSKLYLLKKELSLKKLLEIKRKLNGGKDWKTYSDVECLESSQFLIETSKSLNLSTRDKTSLPPSSTIFFSPYQTLTLSK